jgi:2-dehydro-3-deoxyphosphogluconate aldolase / (4S)-4-hydroxy-2-oxoglutarate aldolase
MKSKSDILKLLTNPGLIGIIRADRKIPAKAIAAALLSGGMRAYEFTLTTPGALDAIAEAKSFSSADAVVGAGSVLNPAHAADAVKAGAEFLVTPTVNLSVIKFCVDNEVPICCGAYTPTEAQIAHEAGSDFVKIFPADNLGPAYIKALLAPLPHLRLVPTGGVTVENCADFFRAGAVALGVGSSLFSKEIFRSENWDALTANARAFSEKVVSLGRV